MPDLVALIVIPVGTSQDVPHDVEAAVKDLAERYPDTFAVVCEDSLVAVGQTLARRCADG